MFEEEFDFENRIVSTSFSAEDSDTDVSLRPKTLDDYIGQDKVKENLKVYIDAAKMRGESLDHVLLYGPPGLGKTTLSNIIATEMGVNIRVTSGPAIEKQGDLAALLTNLSEGDVLFIDEIHRLSRSVEEILYPAMEDYALDIIIGKGPSARSIRIDLPKFTLIGATTRAGQLTTPLRDRFGVVLKLELYTPEQLASVPAGLSDILGLKTDKANMAGLDLRPGLAVFLVDLYFKAMKGNKLIVIELVVWNKYIVVGVSDYRIPEIFINFLYLFGSFRSV